MASIRSRIGENMEYCDGCDLFNEVLDIEVIGNIFDNKELLESEEK